MLIITLPIMTHAVKLDMPQAEPQPPPPERAPRSSISRSTSTARWSGTARRCRAWTSWRAISATRPTKEPQPEIHLRPDRRAQVRLRRAGARRGAAQPHAEDRLRQHGGIQGLTQSSCNAEDITHEGHTLNWLLALAASLALAAPAARPPGRRPPRTAKVSKAVAKTLKAAQEALKPRSMPTRSPRSRRRRRCRTRRRTTSTRSTSSPAGVHRRTKQLRRGRQGARGAPRYRLHARGRHAAADVELLCALNYQLKNYDKAIELRPARHQGRLCHDENKTPRRRRPIT